jgi:glycosyltransferase 2 family protein
LFGDIGGGKGLKRRWQILLGVAISLFFIWLALRGLEMSRVWGYLRTANYWWILPGIAIYFVAVWARTWRWHYLLRPVKVIPLVRLFPIVCIGYFGNNVYPARLGEVFRAVALRATEKVSISTSLATIIIERVFDGLVMLLFVFFALPFVGSEHIPPIYRTTIILASALFGAALLIFLWMAMDQTRASVVYRFLADRLVPVRFRAPLDGFYERFMAGLDFLRSPRDVLMVFATSVLIWLTETVKYWFVMHAFAFSVSFIGLMLMNGVVNLTTTLPSAPGYIGTFEVGARVLEALGVDYGLAFGYTIVLHAALWFPITVLGAFYVWRLGVRWSDVGRAREEGSVTVDSGSAGG